MCGKAEHEDEVENEDDRKSASQTKSETLAASQLPACIWTRLPVEECATGMIHDILRTDIELATRLIADRRPDDKIILALVHRGVDQGPATQLMEDLRKGLKPTPHSPLPPELTMTRRSRSRSVSPGNGSTQASPSSRARSRNGSPAHSAGQGPKRTAAFWLTVVIFVVLVIAAGAFILIQRHRASTDALEEQQPNAAMPKVDKAPLEAQPKTAVPGPNASPP